jgi:hypothetical protein
VACVHFTGCYEIACARSGITKLTPAIKCTSTSVIQADGAKNHAYVGQRSAPTSGHS